MPNVLFFDTFESRHPSFRVKGNGVCQRHVRDFEEFMNVIKERDWDFIFVPNYWTKGFSRELDKEATMKGVEAILALKVPPKLVIFHGLVDDYGIIRLLKEGGQLVCHIPWDTKTPSTHNREA
jgi:hypothetical protein